MKYEFHVGDYIRVGEQSGYLTSCSHTFGEYRFTFVLDDGKERGWSGLIGELPSNITRIGQYDFAKKDRIEQIPMPSITDTWSHERSIISKVNELVDAVNRLKEKIG